MRPQLWLRAFANAPARLRWLGIEAALELLRARCLTLLPPRIYTRTFSTPAKNAHGDMDAREIGKIVATVAHGLPFRALCLQQVIATQRMLARRGCRSTIKLGVRRDETAPAQIGAHAWLLVGGQVVNGEGDLDQFSVIGTFP